MTSLTDAWTWYLAAKRQCQVLYRLGSSHWDQLPWDTGTPLGRDSRLREYTSDGLRADAESVDRPLDDLAVLILFSVFEGIARETVLAGMQPEVDLLRHPALRRAASGAVEDVERGGFFKLLDSLKSPESSDLIEQVNQVRRYRNWVAHGRRTERPDAVSPDAAYERLAKFLEVLPAVVLGEGSTPPPAAGGG